MSVHLKIELLAGSDIESSCREAIRIANMLRVVVDFDFNGVKVMAKPGACPKELAEAWAHELGAAKQIKIACAHPSESGAKFLATGDHP